MWGNEETTLLETGGGERICEGPEKVPESPSVLSNVGWLSPCTNPSGGASWCGHSPSRERQASGSSDGTWNFEKSSLPKVAPTKLSSPGKF